MSITAQLISAEDGCHLWSERYDYALKDISIIQDEVAGNIAAMIESTLAPRQNAASAGDSYDLV
jgi:adenylate cyclase